jgi:ABC-type nitrate/sulfonate/bicarbonate transport system substrate-binding protein
MKTTRRQLIAAGSSAAVLTILLAGCSAPAADSGETGGEGASLGTVRFAFDWTPNTNHTGLYVARELGYFDEVGVNVDFLPYNGSYPDTLVDAGAAECGIGFQESSQVNIAAGAHIKAVMATLQHWVTAIGVRADRDDIQSPRDLDGKIYAGFGSPTDGPLIKTVIQTDGGVGEFDEIALDTTAYEAVYAGSADFTIPFKTWESIEAEIRGTPFKHFEFTDYGMPDNYAVLVNCNTDWLEANPDLAAAFVSALQRGYEFTHESPAEAGDILISAEPSAFSTEEATELVHRSQELISSEYIADESGAVGPMTEDRWAAFGEWLLENGLLADADGAPITESPDWSTFFTNDYLVE